MANELTVLELLEELRAELGHAIEPQHGVDTRSRLILLLNRAQRELWMEVDWDHLKVYRYIAMVAGDRYYDWPSDLDETRVIQAEYKYNDTYLPLEHGINRHHLHFRDSEQDERQDPVLSYDFHYDDSVGGLQFEVWPTPAVSGNIYAATTPPTPETVIPNRNTDGDRFVRLRGIKRLPKMSLDADRSELDGLLIVLRAAAVEAERQEAKNAATIGARAERYLNNVTSRLKKTDAFVMGTDADRGELPKITTLNSVRFRYATRNP